MMKHINPVIFYPPICILLVIILGSVIDAEGVVQILDGVRKWILQYFDWLFNGVVFSYFIVVVTI